MCTVKRPLTKFRPVRSARAAFPFFGWLAALAVGVTTMAPATAHAEGPTPAPANAATPPPNNTTPSTDYCRKVTARADADAAQLFAPTLAVNVIRYPQSAILDTLGVNVGRGVQPRAMLSVGIVDIYKGFGVRDVAEKDCARQETAMTLAEMITQRDEAGRRIALGRKIEYLKAHESELSAILNQAEQRFTAGITTLVEMHDLRRRVLDASKQLAEAERGLAAIESRGAALPNESLEDLVKQYESRSIAYEESVQHVRNLSPWKLDVTGGATAHPNIDYFGVVQLSYNFGGIFALGAEQRAVDARAAELKNARYEMRHQVESLRRELRASVDFLKKQVARIDEELAHLAKERAVIEPTEAPNKSHLLAVLSLQVIDLEAERVFLNALAERQSAIGGRQ